MTTKLHIDVSQGIISIEGDPEFVREVYRDLKAQLLDSVTFVAPKNVSTLSRSPPDPIENASRGGEGVKPRAKRRVASKKKSKGEEIGSDVIADSPKLDKNLDTSGLPAFYSRFEVKNHPQKVLVFLKFLTDELGIDDPNTDQFYTCYEKVNERVPKVFSQAFRDASGRKFGYIDYNSPTDIKVTTVGNNFFKFDLKKKIPE